MVPTGGTDLVSTYGFDVLHLGGRGLGLISFEVSIQFCIFFHCRDGGGLHAILKKKLKSPSLPPPLLVDSKLTWKLINRKSSDANILFSDRFSLAREHFQTQMMGACAKSYLVFLFLLLQQNMGKNYLYRVYRYYFDFSSGTLFCHIWQYCVD